MSVVDWLDACEQIRQLASRYAVALNHRDLDALTDLFVPPERDARQTVRAAAIRANFAQQLRPLGRTILQVTNHVIDVADHQSATGVAGTRGEIEQGDEWIVQVIEYHDTYRCVDGRWYFINRNHLLWYGAPLGQSPIGMPPANWPASATGAGDLPWAMPSWQAWEEGN